MTDDQEVIRSLNQEQAIERARATALEAEYWRQVLDDLHELHEGVHAIADELQSSTLAVLGLLPLVEQAGTGSLETIVTANNAGMRRLRLMQETLTRTLDLVGGRAKVTQQTIDAAAEALGIELDNGDDEAER